MKKTIIILMILVLIPLSQAYLIKEVGYLTPQEFLAYSEEDIAGYFLTVIDDTTNIHDYHVDNGGFTIYYPTLSVYFDEESGNFTMIQKTFDTKLSLDVVRYCREEYSDNICFSHLFNRAEPYNVTINNETYLIEPIKYQLGTQAYEEYIRIVNLQQEYSDRNFIMEFLESIGIIE